MITSCEVCASSLDGPIVDFGSHPLNDAMTEIGRTPSFEKYPQRIQLCKICMTAHQLSPVEKEILFFPEYRYRGSVTRDVLSGMNDLIENALTYYGDVAPKIVLDIGANDGSLLGIIKKKTGCTTIGVDPTDAIQKNQGRVDHVYQGFFDTQLALKIKRDLGAPDLITFTNVFAHIEDLPKLIEAVSHLLTDTNLLVIENHYLGSVLMNNQFDTFYAEHLRTYSARSFEFIAKALSLDVKSLQFPRRYGGNIRVYLSRNKKLPKANFHFPEENFVSSFANLQNIYDRWKSNSLAVVDSLLKEGHLIGKSCPARSVMLYSSLGMDNTKMKAVYEHPNSPKIGYCVPGTAIPILSDEELTRETGSNLILWSWHIAYEIVPYLEEIGFRGKIWTPLPEFKLLAEI